MHPYQVLCRPLITEKNTELQTLGKYAFEVAGKANKQQVKEAVEKTFKVKVTAVNMISVSGKSRIVGRRRVLTRSWKKAIVTLQQGDNIQFFEGV
ncbi:MAG: 50S ribosomal protein L23 [Dehalococcoidales bacterium]